MPPSPTSARRRGRLAVPDRSLPRPGRAGRGLCRQDTELHREVALKQIQDRHGDHAESRTPVPAGGGDHRGSGASGHRAGLRAGTLRRRPAVLRHAVHQGRQPQEGDRASSIGAGAAGRGPASGCWSFRSCCGGSWTSATPSPMPTAGVCCTATSSRATSWSGHFGETLVVDWGLAKVVGTDGDLGRGDAPAAVGQRVERDAAGLGDRAPRHS